MLSYNEMFEVLDLIKDYEKQLRSWQDSAPAMAYMHQYCGDFTEEDEENIKQHELALEELQKRMVSRLAPYVDHPQMVVPYIEQL